MFVMDFFRRAGRLVLSFCFLVVFQVAAQRPDRAEITSLDFTGNETVATNELLSFISTKETPGALSKFLYKNISEGLGKKDEFLDQAVLGEDLLLIRKYYENQGFFEAIIDSSFTFSEDGSEVEITISIAEGYRSIIDSLTYRGIVNVPDFVCTDLENKKKIGRGDFYNQGLLRAEIDNVITVLKNAGYPNARYIPDSSWAIRPLSLRNFIVVLSFDIGDRFLFGPITILRADTTIDHPVTDEIVLDHLEYREGKFYSNIEVIESERNLNRLGLFDVARIKVFPPPNEDTAISVPSTVLLRQSEKHELAPELVLSDENANLNIGVGLGYKHRDFFGGGRTFSTHFRIRTQTPGKFPDYFSLTSDAISNVDLTFELLQPYVFSSKIKGTWSFSFILDKQRPYRQFIVRNKFGFSAKFAEFTSGYLDWSLERVKLETSPTIVGTPDEIEELEKQAREVQFNSIISFTIERNKANDIFSPSSGFIHAFTVEESGVLPLILEPKLPFTQFYRFILLGRWYFDPSFKKQTIMGMKLKAGLEEKYGESRRDDDRVIPQTHRFFAGGGGSVRGWQSRSLTATGDPRAESGGNLALEGSIERRMNVFYSARDGFWDKFWAVVFLDAGTVWGEINDFQFQDIAIATGAGIRYDTFFGPFRIDFGMRVYDPNPEYGKKWIFQRKFWSETIAEGALHFGIGHAF